MHHWNCRELLILLKKLHIAGAVFTQQMASVTLNRQYPATSQSTLMVICSLRYVLVVCHVFDMSYCVYVCIVRSLARLQT